MLIEWIYKEEFSFVNEEMHHILVYIYDKTYKFVSKLMLNITSNNCLIGIADIPFSKYLSQGWFICINMHFLYRITNSENISIFNLTNPLSRSFKLCYKLFLIDLIYLILNNVKKNTHTQCNITSSEIYIYITRIYNNSIYCI